MKSQEIIKLGIPKIGKTISEKPVVGRTEPEYANQTKIIPKTRPRPKSIFFIV